MQVLSAPDTSFLLEMLVPVLVLVVASTQRPMPPAPPNLGLDMKTSLLASAARSRADRTRRAHPRTHEPSSAFGQRFPRLGAMGPRHTPAVAHNALKPQAIARRRAFKGHAQVCAAGRA